MKAIEWIAVILTAILVGAKLVSVITWTWWLVLSPAVVVFLLPLFIVLLAVIFMLICGAIKVIWEICTAFWQSLKQGFEKGFNNENSKR